MPSSLAAPLSTYLRLELSENKCRSPSALLFRFVRDGFAEILATAEGPSRNLRLQRRPGSITNSTGVDIAPGPFGGYRTTRCPLTSAGHLVRLRLLPTVAVVSDTWPWQVLSSCLLAESVKDLRQAPPFFFGKLHQSCFLQESLSRWTGADVFLACLHETQLYCHSRLESFFLSP